MTELKEKILKLRSEGKTYREIQKSLSCSKGTISYHLNAETKQKANFYQYNRRYELYKFTTDYKVEHGCKVCGEKHPAVLTFHHRDPSSKSFGISDGINYNKYSTKKLLVEMEKCDVMCFNCHHKLHWETDERKSDLPL